MLKGGKKKMNRYVMFQKQTFATETFSAFDTASKAHAIDQVSEDISFEHGFVNPVTSAKRAPRNRLLGPITGGGEVGVPMYTRGFPTLAYYALGKDVTTAVTNGFKHVITPSGSIPSFRMGVGKDKKEHRFVGCAVKSMKLDYSVDNPALATFDLLCRKELEPGDLQTVTFPDYDVKERSFLGVEVSVKIDDVAVAYVRSLNIEVNNTLVEDNHTFGSRYLPNLVVQDLEVKGSMELSFTDIQRYEEVRDEDQPSIELLFNHDTVDTAEHRALNVKLPEVSLDMGKLPTDGNKEYIMSIDFTAQSDDNTDKVIEMTVINEEASAAHIL